jgi:hypothetical protein
LAALRDIVARVLPGRREEAAIPPADDDGLFPLDPAMPIVLVTAFGIGVSALDGALDRALAGTPAQRRVVCLTDQPDFLPLRRRGISFEYLPPQSARAAAFGDPRIWQAYLTERYEILLAKWRPSQIVAAGASLEQFVSGRPD